VEHFPVSRTAQGLQIEGITDAAKLVAIEGPKAQHLAQLELHRSDLEFADHCLEAINAASENRLLRQALWRSAIVYFTKCFGRSDARFQLDAGRIYKGEPDGMVAYKYFKDLRDKHLVHDENAYAQSLPAAALNDGRKGYKIEKIVCLDVQAETLDQGNFSNLKLLIARAREWVVTEFDQVCAILTKDLERETYESLCARREVKFTIPKLEELGKSRR
jgi:hypothetical protein